MAGNRSYLHSCCIPRSSAAICFAVIGIHVHRDLGDNGLDQLEKISPDNILYRAAESDLEVKNAPVLMAVTFFAALNSLQIARAPLSH